MGLIGYIRYNIKAEELEDVVIASWDRLKTIIVFTTSYYSIFCE